MDFELSVSARERGHPLLSFRFLFMSLKTVRVSNAERSTRRFEIPVPPGQRGNSRSTGKRPRLRPNGPDGVSGNRKFENPSPSSRESAICAPGMRNGLSGSQSAVSDRPNRLNYPLPTAASITRPDIGATCAKPPRPAGTARLGKGLSSFIGRKVHLGSYP